MKRYALILLATSSAWIVQADEPPSWQAFTVCSETQRYCADVRPVTETNEPWTVEWQLVVTEQGSSTVLWQSQFFPSGYDDGGMLSEDGATFVKVSFWYYPEKPVVTIYRVNGRHTLEGDEFEISRWKLQKTASHRLWLAQGQKAYEFSGNDRLTVITIDQRSHSIDLKTGELIGKQQ